MPQLGFIYLVHQTWGLVHWCVGSTPTHHMYEYSILRMVRLTICGELNRFDEMKKSNKYLELYQSNNPVAQCGCGSSPLLSSFMEAGVLSFGIFCPDCGVGTSLCPDCDNAVAVWNLAMKGHKKDEWCAYYDSRGDNLSTELDKVEAAIEQNCSDAEENAVNRLVEYIDSKMPRHSVDANGRRKISRYVQKYSYDAIVKAVNISADQYIVYEGDSVTDDSANDFLNKIGGILHNMHLSPVDKEVSHIKSMARQQFGYFNENIGESLMRRYVGALRSAGYSETEVLDDLKTEMKRLVYRSSSWTSWRNAVEDWIDELEGNNVEL